MANEQKQIKPLIGLTRDELITLATGLGLPSFVGKQMSEWIYGRKVLHTDEMTNLSKAARLKLFENGYVIGALPPADCQRSVDGTVKYLFPTNGGHFVETVFIPDGERGTLCVSCQVGCKMGCAFCMTGRQGFEASLSVSEILNQIYSLPERERLTNIVFMGQGEPFDNLDAVMRATEVLTAEWGWAWSPKRITVSSVGLRKGLQRFIEESRCSLAISLHHPLPEGRAEIMPAERAFSIREVADVLRRYDEFCRTERPTGVSKQRRLTFEYIVFDGLNDSERHAAALISLLRGLDCRINLIRFHDIPDSPFRGASEEKMVHFRDYLTRHGIYTTIRASRGQDIYAACGLLSTAEKEKNIQ